MPPSLVPEIADDIVAVDEAMRLGYNWKFGPFELIDQIGAGMARRAAGGRGQADVPPLLRRPAGERASIASRTAQLEYLGTDGDYRDVAPRPRACCCSTTSSATSKPLLKNGSAALWDVGDGVACLEFHSKMNALDATVMELLGKAIDARRQAASFKALVVYNEGEQFLGRRQSRPRALRGQHRRLGRDREARSPAGRRPTRR